jgi:SPP1 gp7 family putative phage head morphogenesis protein
LIQGRLQQLILQYRAQLLHKEQQAVDTLTSAYTHILAVIQAQLAKLYRDVNTKQQNGEDIPISWLYQENRLQSAKLFIAKEIGHYGQLAQITTQQLRHFAVGLGQQSAQQQLHVVTGERLITPPTPSVIQNLIGATKAGTPLSDLFKGFGDEAAQGAADALIRGVTLGSSTQRMAKDVEQALQVPRNRATTIASNETFRAYRSANVETYRASGLVEQWRWIASKSGRTCPVCIAMDGILHDMDEEMESHVRCRCTMIPVRAGSSMSYQTGVEWFDGQSESVQKEVLGAKYQGWANGDFTLHDMVGHSHDPEWGGSLYEKSLKQLKKAG